MKIAIITFHASDNCGSQLQTYALSKVIKEHFGVTPDVIDFSNRHQQEMYATFKGQRDRYIDSLTIYR